MLVFLGGRGGFESGLLSASESAADMMRSILNDNEGEGGIEKVEKSFRLHKNLTHQSQPHESSRGGVLNVPEALMKDVSACSVNTCCSSGVE